MRTVSEMEADRGETMIFRIVDIHMKNCFVHVWRKEEKNGPAVVDVKKKKLVIQYLEEI